MSENLFWPHEAYKVYYKLKTSLRFLYICHILHNGDLAGHCLDFFSNLGIFLGLRIAFMLDCLQANPNVRYR